MKKHLALYLTAILVFGGLVMLTSTANATRSECRDSGATSWKVIDTFGNLRIVVGTSGDDVFVPENDAKKRRLIVFGLAGNDIICGSDADDVLVGGPGNDVLVGRSGSDRVHGGEGNDVISGGPGSDVLNGGSGHDLIVDGEPSDEISGGEGVDLIRNTDLQPRGRDKPKPTPKQKQKGPKATPTALPTPTATATPTPTVVPDVTPPTPTPTVVPDEPTPTPTPEATPPTPTPTTPPPTPTATPTMQPPTPTATASPTPGGSAFPRNHSESVALIEGASATITERKAIVWDRNQRMNFPVNAGNPNLYTPSDELNFNDYVHYQGSQYGPPKGRGATGGVFHATCQFSHLAYDDPIVFPNQPGRSHLHMFFGNSQANAFSTTDTILNQGGSTCSRGELNRTSYWIPAAIDGNSNVLVPDQFMVYYESYDEEWDTLQAFPEGLKLVEGNAMATSVQDNITNYGAPSVVWKCGWYTTSRLGGGGAAGAYQSTPPDCSDSTYSHIEMQIKWPFCWDGQNLDSPDHKAHVVFPRAGNGFFYPGTCPVSHPVTLPRITYRVHFSTSTVSSPTSQILLSSDVQPADGTLSPEGVSGHGDWFGGWNRDLLQGMVDRCILTGQECDEMHYGTPAGDQAAATLIEGRVITPQQVQEYCPLRTSFNGDISDIAYCRP